ncbi:hypothetical protein GJ496_006450 [Pomphorhynchus laevis]|nr:hypothetical protein GJ496_006450 [Pomphorhynchus laevis]
MPLPTFTSVPRYLANQDDSKITALTISGDSIYYWKKSDSNEQQSLCSINISFGFTKSVQLQNISKSFIPLAIVAHSIRNLFIVYNSSTVFLVDWQSGNSTCSCTPLCSKLMQSKKRLRILSCKWAPILNDNAESFCSEICVVLFSDNKCRCFTCDSPQIVLNEVDLSDPEDKLDNDGLGFLSDISFDRAICMDFGKPIATVTCDSNPKNACITRIPLFILKSSGEIFCALFVSLIQSSYQLFGPLFIESYPEKPTYWPYEFICLQTDIPILAIVYKGQECRAVDHCVVFFEDDGKQQRLKGKVYETIDINTASTDISIVKDPTFCERYFLYSNADLIAVDLQWSWLFSKTIPNDLFDYALNHGALEVVSLTKKIYSTSRESGNTITSVALSHNSLSRQDIVIVTDKNVILIGLSTDTSSKRVLFNKNACEIDEEDDNYVIDQLGLPATAKICDVEKLIANLRISSLPFSLVNNDDEIKKKCVERLAVHNDVTTLLEESKQDQSKRLKELTQVMEVNILPNLEMISRKQIEIAKRLKKEIVVQSNLNDRLMQVANVIDNSDVDITSSEHRIQDWADKALKKCHLELYPKVQENLLSINENSNSTYIIRGRDMASKLQTKT